MKLRAERAGPYVRALAAGLYALAPHDDFVPMAEALATLRALDPALSGDLLLPATVDPTDGMPSVAWVQRARAEQTIVGEPPDVASIARARVSDPQLADRMAARAALWRFLSDATLLPASRVVVAARRLGDVNALTARFDRLAPGGWERLRLELTAKRLTGPIWLDDAGQIQAHDSLRHLLARHAAAPLDAIREQVASTLGMSVTRVSRGRIGPFWFPGVTLPYAVPKALGQGLTLHLSVEVLAEEIQRSAHQDPLTKPLTPPEGMRVFQQRRFAATADVLQSLTRWSAERGVQTVPVALVPIR